MATPAERAQHKHAHKHGRRHHNDPADVQRARVAAAMRAGGARAVTYGVSAYGTNNGYTNPPTAGPAPGPMDIPQSGHLSPEQFVGYPGGFSTDAGNYTGVEAIEGAAGNGGAGGTGDSGGATA